MYHWTDKHIIVDESTGEFVAYDEAGLEYARFASKREARNAFVWYADNVLNKVNEQSDLMNFDCDEKIC